MKSEPLSVQQIFQDRRQYHVPFYQRAYVWNKEDQWERLWEDIQEKADERLTGSAGNPHFLGAAVLEPQQRRGLVGVESLHIIDGQQRLTTLQYVLAALAIILRESNQGSLLAVVETCRWNTNKETMQQPEIETFKLWPTFRDRAAYGRAMHAESKDALRNSFPDSFTQSDKLRHIGIDHPPALESVWYFVEEISKWINTTGESNTNARIEAVVEAVLKDLSIVVISLGEGDDAQIIFETLNGHGAELYATDLIRNYIFMRADRDGADGLQLYDKIWSQFESSYWSDKQRRGRLIKPRMEWFIQSILQAELKDEIDPGRLYPGYKRFVMTSAPPLSAQIQLDCLNSQAVNYKLMQQGDASVAIGRFGARIEPWDVSSAVSIALAVAKSNMAGDEQTQIFDAILSYIARRAICGLTNKSYNKIFIQILKEGDITVEGITKYLSNLDGESSRWPGDNEFQRAWLEDPIYPGRLDAAKMRAILSELETHMRSSRSEDPYRSGAATLDIEHVLPMSWYEHWSLNDGSKATENELKSTELSALLGEILSEPQKLILEREKAKRQMGNLTLLQYGVNRGLQNYDFQRKREAFFRESNLHLNRKFMTMESWDEVGIRARGLELFDLAKKIWRSPSS